MNPETILNAQTMTEIDISIYGLILSFLVSMVCSFIIRTMYVNYGRSLNNRIHFASNFILLAVTTTVIISVVKFSFALSLGLVGALSIVRFRAAIREPEELVYLFIIISIGISSGANQYLATIIFTLFLSATIYIYYKYFTKNEKNSATLSTNLINVSCKDLSFDKLNSELTLILNAHVNFYSLKNYSKNKNEITFSYIFSNNVRKEKEFIKKINTFTTGAKSVDLLSNLNIAE